MEGKERDRKIAMRTYREKNKLDGYTKRIAEFNEMLKDRKTDNVKREMVRRNIEFAEKHMDILREDIRQR